LSPLMSFWLTNNIWRAHIMKTHHSTVSPPASSYCIPPFFLSALLPNSGLGGHHESFRFTSVTRSRRVGRTPWTDDQLVATQTLNIHA
jgi:hypothetical protein